MANSPVPDVHRFSSAFALCLAFSIVGQAGAQTPTQLTPAIRNLDRDDPATITALPRLLSQTGLYRNIGNKATRAIADTSVAPFQVNSALWSDGSQKERFISLLPGTKVTPTDTSKFTFPDGAALIKNFLIDTVYGDNTGNSRIFIETRFMVYQSGPSGKKWSGISYRWLRDQSDAVLVHPDSGLDYTHNVVLNGKRVGKRWRYPSSMDCTQCHRGDESTSRGTLGFVTPQLNRVVNGTNQLQSLFARGILSANPVAGKPNAHRWYGLAEDSVTLEKRVRSYFASNCSHCHGNNVAHAQAKQNFDYFVANKRITYQEDPNTFDDPTGAWVGMPSMSGGSFGWLVLPGHPDSSVVLDKMKRRMDEYLSMENREQMPPLATSQPDSAAVKLIEQWICSLKPGTPCGKIPWSPDETFWAPEEVVSVRPHGKFQDPALQASMRNGRLSVPAHIAAAGKVELRDYRGRKVSLVREGDGLFRIPRTLTPGIYFLIAGRHRVSLNYMP
jgi:mono/diheme cytochrome c family protein